MLFYTQLFLLVSMYCEFYITPLNFHICWYQMYQSKFKFFVSLIGRTRKEVFQIVYTYYLAEIALSIFCLIASVCSFSLACLSANRSSCIISSSLSVLPVAAGADCTVPPLLPALLVPTLGRGTDLAYSNTWKTKIHLFIKLCIKYVFLQWRHNQLNE